MVNFTVFTWIIVVVIVFIAVISVALYYSVTTG